jgi:hypothetical protein
MVLEIAVLIIILAGIGWLFGGGRIVIVVAGGAVATFISCVTIYVTFALLHKWLGPFIFG